MTVELKDLYYFTEIVKHGSFTKAAEQNYFSQPTLSKSMKKLEAELNITLFERSTRKLMLTDAGEIVHQQAVKILSAANDLPLLLDDLQNLPAGTIKIGIPPLIGTLFFPAIAENFGAIHPDVSLELIELGAKRIEQLVEDGQADAGIVVLPVDHSKFDTVPFVKDEFMLFTNPAHLLADKREVKMEELAEEKFILFNPEFSLHRLIIQHCRNAGFDPDIAYKSSQWDLITELVISRLGITLLPKIIYSKMDKEAIRMIPVVSPPMWELAVITKKNRYLPYAVRALLRFLEEEF